MANPPKEAKSVMMGRRRVRDSESYLLRHAAHSPVKLGIQGAKLLAEGCCNVAHVARGPNPDGDAPSSR